MYHAGIFDLDDTLYDYESLNKVAVMRLRTFTCERIGIQASEFDKAYRQARLLVKKRHAKVAAGHNRILYFQSLLELLSCRPLTLSLDMYEVYWKTILEQMRLRDGVLSLLQKMRDNSMKIAICTDLTTNIQLRKLKKLQIENFVDVLVTSEEAGCEKPEAIMFELCLKKLGLSATQCFLCGDSLEKDILGALKMQIQPVWFQTNNDGKIITGDYHKVINFSELSDWIFNSNVQNEQQNSEWFQKIYKGTNGIY